MAETFSNPEETQTLLVIKVATRSGPPAVAGAIAGVIRERGWVEVQAIGAGAVNQAAKALAIARAYLLKEEIDIYFYAHFMELVIENHERTVMAFHVERRADGRNGANGQM